MRYKIINITYVVLLSLHSVFGQYNLDMGFSFGASNYLGEIGGTNIESKGFIGDLLLKQSNVTAGWFIRQKYHLN